MLGDAERKQGERHREVHRSWHEMDYLLQAVTIKSGISLMLQAVRYSSGPAHSPSSDLMEDVPPGGRKVHSGEMAGPMPGVSGYCPLTQS